MEEYGEEIREKLRKQIEERAKRIDAREQELLEEVESLDECFEREFLSALNKIKYKDGKTLKDYMCEEETDISDFPVDFIAKDFINDNMDEILQSIKAKSVEDFETMDWYRDTVVFTKKYYDIFVYNYNIDAHINLTHVGFARNPYGKNLNTSSSKIVNFEKQSVVAKYPKNKITKSFNFKMMEQNLEDSIFEVERDINTKQFENIYKTLEKEIFKDMNKKIKAKFVGLNYALRGVDIFKFNLKHILIPVYTVRCYKPGFDVEYLVFGTTKKAVKD